MNKKKGQINQIFVYILSIIMILFVGFLVTNFIISFTSDVENSKEAKIYQNLKIDYQKIYTNWGSEKIFSYQTSNDKNILCFIDKIDNLSTENCKYLSNEQIDLIRELSSLNNIFLFGENNFFNSHEIGKFETDSHCLCIKSISNKFQIFMENKRNKVIISDIKDFT